MSSSRERSSRNYFPQDSTSYQAPRNDRYYIRRQDTPARSSQYPHGSQHYYYSRPVSEYLPTVAPERHMPGTVQRRIEAQNAEISRRRQPSPEERDSGGKRHLGEKRVRFLLPSSNTDKYSQKESRIRCVNCGHITRV